MSSTCRRRPPSQAAELTAGVRSIVVQLGQKPSVDAERIRGAYRWQVSTFDRCSPRPLLSSCSVRRGGAWSRPSPTAESPPMEGSSRCCGWCFSPPLLFWRGSRSAHPLPHRGHVRRPCVVQVLVICRESAALNAAPARFRLGGCEPTTGCAGTASGSPCTHGRLCQGGAARFRDH